MESSQFTELEELYYTCGLIGFDVQCQFMDHLSRFKDWNIELEKGIIRFASDGDSLQLPIQFLGKYDKTSQAFHWAWEDSFDHDRPFFEFANKLKKLGETRGISTFADSPAALFEDYTWHHLALTALGLVRCSGYFASEKEDESMVYLIQSPELNEKYLDPGIDRLKAVYPLFCQRSANRVQAAALKAYARIAGIEVEDQTAGLKLTDERGNSTVALFGHQLEWIDFT